MLFWTKLDSLQWLWCSATVELACKPRVFCDPWSTKNTNMFEFGQFELQVWRNSSQQKAHFPSLAKISKIDSFLQPRYRISF